MAPVIEARRGPWKKADFTVLLMMANYAWPDGTNIFPSVPVMALACRLKERQVQASIKALLKDKVLTLVKRANESGFGGRRTNEYAIDMARVQKMQGCKICGGIRCGDKGCAEAPHPRKKQQGTGAENNRGRVQKTASVYRRTRQRPVIETGAGTPRTAERRGDSALWESIAAKTEPDLALKLQCWGAAPMLEAGRVVIDFEKDWSERYVSPLRADLQSALGMPIVFRYAGRVGQ
jgi:hypothetical protein